MKKRLGTDSILTGKDSMVGEHWMYHMVEGLISFLRCHKDITNLPMHFGHA